MEILFKLGIAILVGLAGGKLANKVKMPKVSGYIIAGLLLGPSLIHLFTEVELSSLNIVNDMALACITFGIGSSFLLSDLKQMGKNSFIITVAEVLGSLLIVFLAMHFVFGKSIAFSLVIASMSAATEPAGLVMVINELKADGPLSRNILPVAAFDDAVGIMVFGISVQIAKILLKGSQVSAISIISKPLLEIVFSVILGIILGVVMSYIGSKIKEEEQLAAFASGMLLLTVGIGKFTGLSPLLSCMVMGGIVINTTSSYKKIFKAVNSLTPSLNILFFTLAGASLDLRILPTVGLIGVGFIVARALGKIIGATSGAQIVNSEPEVKKYLGMSILTLGGISIGLSMNVKEMLPEMGSSIVTIMLFSVIVFEIAGPILAKIGIIKAGEVNGMLENKK